MRVAQGLDIGSPRFKRRDYPNETTYYVEVDLRMRGFYQLYCVTLDENRKVKEFMPRGFIIRGSVGPNTVTDEAIRQSILDSVSQLNEHLKLKYYGEPAIQKIEDYYLVTFSSLSPDEVKHLKETNQWVLDPFVNFLVTEDHGVFGVFFGA